jgi:hypothetical protein
MRPFLNRDTLNITVSFLVRSLHTAKTPLNSIRPSIGR